ncbi:MAG: alpha/beta hydrolase [Alphaproteobacteria bacterium]|nr:alpha/beta hydrolase [Alphaproteobacteria bacterium]MBL6939969.1 alpha/beta hydrolase [Alphaproteobacteria bacterium]MBL7098175.1 alpha/beta hydrolase [Alphaproteobacteria bacterium]
MTMQALAVQTGPQTVMLDVGGTKIAVMRAGQGPAIVCLHAIAHGARDFVKLAERLGSRFTFYAIDFPGHGQSPFDGVTPTPRHYAALLEGVVDALGLKRFGIIGCSIGGATAIRYAAAHPDRVAAMALCNSGGMQKIGLLARIVCDHYARFFAKGERGDKDYPRKFRRYYETVLPGAPAAWRREEIVADAYKTAGLLRQAWQNFAKPEADLRHLLPAVKCPVLLAWAKDDKAVSWGGSKAAALTIPHHTVALLDGGHAAFLEAPEAFDAALLRFAAALPQPATV